MQGLFRPLLRQEGIEHARCLAAQLFFLHQDIDGENDSENKVENCAENRSGDADCSVDQLAGIALEVIHHGIADFLPVNFQVGEGRGVHLEEGGGLGDPILHLHGILRHVFNQQTEGTLELWHDHKNQDEYEADDDAEGEYNAYNAAYPAPQAKIFAVERREQPLLNHLEQNVEDKSGAKSDDERHQKAQCGAANTHHRGNILQP